MNTEQYNELNSRLYKMIVEAVPFKDIDPAEYAHRKQEIAVLVLGSGLLKQVVNGFRRTNKKDEGFFDDLYQEGCVAVVKTIDRFRVSSTLVTEFVPKPPRVVNGRFNLELLDYEPQRYRVVPENYNFLYLARRYAKLSMVRFIKRNRSRVEVREEIAPYLAHPDREVGSDPESLLLAREAQVQCLAGLTQVEREALLGREEGDKLREIANRLGISIEGVRKAEARAVRKIAAGMGAAA